MKRLSRSSLTCLLLFLVSTLPGAAQQDFSEVEIKSQKVSGNIYMMTGAGGNLGVSVGEDGIILIDDQYAPLAPRIRAALSDLSEADVLYVLNTHWHGDHTGGNEFFGEIAPVVSHHNVRKRLAEGSAEREIAPAPAGALPVLTFGEDLTLHLNGETIRAIHLPHGHTDGDIVIWFPESNVIHMGDHYFAKRFPFIDLASGGSVRGMMRNIEQVIEMVPADIQIIPGHGPLSNVEELREYLKMLEETSAIVTAAIAEGRTFEQMKSDAVLADWDGWSWNFITTERHLQTLFQDLSKPDEHAHHGSAHSHGRVTKKD